MKTYNVVIDDKVVANTDHEATAYRFYDDLIMLMPSSDIKVVDAVREERQNER